MSKLIKWRQVVGVTDGPHHPRRCGLCRKAGRVESTRALAEPPTAANHADAIVNALQQIERATVATAALLTEIREHLLPIGRGRY